MERETKRQKEGQTTEDQNEKNRKEGKPFQGLYDLPNKVKVDS